MNHTEGSRAEHDVVESTGPRGVLLIAWEYPGVNSRQGTALARRVGQLARGFARCGWRVDVIHRLASDTVIRSGETARTIRLHGVEDAYSLKADQGWIARRLTTAWYGARHGDRSGQWAKRVLRQIKNWDSEPPDLVIGCFTPRGPLAVARSAAKRWRVPWIADLQDPVLEGASDVVKPFVRRWMRRTLKSAAAVVQVSPEWARTDADVLGRKVETIRHAVPIFDEVTSHRAVPSSAHAFVLLYAGSLISEHQSPSALMTALDQLNGSGPSRVVLRVAGTEATRRKFERASGVKERSWFQPLGWMNQVELRDEIVSAHCLVVIPSNDKTRPVVPSKLYEYLAYDRPVLIAGPDSGGIATLLSEWKHPDVVHASPEAIHHALARAQSGDHSLLLRRSACAVSPLGEDELIDRYLELVPTLRTRGPRY